MAFDGFDVGSEAMRLIDASGEVSAARLSEIRRSDFKLQRLMEVGPSAQEATADVGPDLMHAAAGDPVSHHEQRTRMRHEIARAVRVLDECQLGWRLPLLDGMHDEIALDATHANGFDRATAVP